MDLYPRMEARHKPRFDNWLEASQKCFSTMEKRTNLVVKWSLDPALRDRFEDVFLAEKLGNKKKKSIAAFAAIRDFLDRKNPAQRKAMVEAERLNLAEHRAAKIRERINQNAPVKKPTRRSILQRRQSEPEKGTA